ncbi:RNA polymerase sigma factor [Mesorhizobium sp. M4B.F.Ca.ET.143.01.1.1]|uniref:RNA polymerase sigma factor n=1 Tax=Mesorhizobium sp. M4B.F.Ca.ET.143.01.1.1 TaxID=2563947 RepID=UPI00109383F2|nr:RNA polymerase sigma factor [Mesorhizobium sp. M4B.F.Ca.ET.143.01.1.1]TGV22724.1 RNA polymerase sigma factor [Mesorhizobium sp. M4B.F.Ca.ET.143.01.1.1]
MTMVRQGKRGEAEPAVPEDVDQRYTLAVELLGGALARLAAGYESDPAERQDLVQDIHLQVWRSLRSFDGRCSLRTWVYRVAHNVAADHVGRARRRKGMISLDQCAAEIAADPRPTPEMEVSDKLALAQIHAMLHRLQPIDRQVMILYLEDESAVTIAEVSGLSAGAVATRISRIKRLLAGQLNLEATP